MKTIYLLFFCFLLSLNSSAQLLVDLNGPQVQTESIDLGRAPVLVIQNMVPNSNFVYKFGVEFSEQDVPPLPTGGGTGSSCSSPQAAKVQTAMGNLTNAADESDVPGKIKALRLEMEALAKQGSSATICLQEAEDLIARTSYSRDLSFSLRNNLEITVTVTRIKNKKDTVTWKVVFKTPVKSPWHLMYGFTFIPNRMNPVTNYFSMADTSGQFYTITPLNNQNRFFRNVSPTLMFTYIPMRTYPGIGGIFSNRFYQFGFTAGVSLGFADDAAKVNVMAAPSLIIAKNVSFSFGVAMTQKQVLKGEYKGGDRLNERLDFDQLHEYKYMPEWFVSLSLRFDRNPFSQEKDK